jgi:hypothetical protein
MRRAILTIIGAVAGVLALQLLLTLPAAGLLFGVFWCLQHLIGRLDGMPQIVWNLVVIFSLLGLCVLGTILALTVGWGVAARIASGTTVAHSLAASRALNVLLNHIPFARSIAGRFSTSDSSGSYR